MQLIKTRLPTRLVITILSVLLVVTSLFPAGITSAQTVDSIDPAVTVGGDGNWSNQGSGNTDGTAFTSEGNNGVPRLAGAHSYSDLYASYVYSKMSGATADGMDSSMKDLGSYPKLNEGGFDAESYGRMDNSTVIGLRKGTEVGAQTASYIKTLYDYEYLVTSGRGGSNTWYDSIIENISDNISGATVSILLYTAKMGEMLYSVSFFAIELMHNAAINLNVPALLNLGAQNMIGNDDGNFISEIIKSIIDWTGFSAQTIQLLQNLTLAIIVIIFLVTVTIALTMMRGGPRNAIGTTKVFAFRIITAFLTIPLTVMLTQGANEIVGSIEEDFIDSSAYTVDQSIIVDTLHFATALNLNLGAVASGETSISGDRIQVLEQFEPTQDRIRNLNATINQVMLAEGETLDSQDRLGGFLNQDTINVNSYFNLIKGSSDRSSLAAMNLAGHNPSNADNTVGLVQRPGDILEGGTERVPVWTNNVYFLHENPDAHEEYLAAFETDEDTGVIKTDEESLETAVETLELDATNAIKLIEIQPILADYMFPIADNAPMLATKVTLDNPETYIYGAMPSEDATQQHIRYSNFINSQSSSQDWNPMTGDNDFDGIGAEGDGVNHYEDMMKQNAAGVMYYNRYSGINKINGVESLSTQSVTYLLQTHNPSGQTLEYKGVNTVPSEDGEAKNQGAGGNEFVRYVIPNTGMADLFVKVSTLNILWLTTGIVAVVALLYLLRAPVIGAILKMFTNFFKALFTGNLVALIVYILYYLAMRLSFLFAKIAVHLGAMTVTFFLDLVGLDGFLGSMMTPLTGALGSIMSVIFCLILAFILTWPVMTIPLKGQSRKLSFVGVMVLMFFTVAEVVEDSLDRLHQIMYGKSQNDGVMGRLAGQTGMVNQGDKLKSAGGAIAKTGGMLALGAATGGTALAGKMAGSAALKTAGGAAMKKMGGITSKVAEGSAQAGSAGVPGAGQSMLSKFGDTLSTKGESLVTAGKEQNEFAGIMKDSEKTSKSVDKEHNSALTGRKRKPRTTADILGRNSNIANDDTTTSNTSENQSMYDANDNTIDANGNTIDANGNTIDSRNVSNRQNSNAENINDENAVTRGRVRTDDQIDPETNQRIDQRNNSIDNQHNDNVANQTNEQRANDDDTRDIHAGVINLHGNTNQQDENVGVVNADQFNADENDSIKRSTSAETSEDEITKSNQSMYDDEQNINNQDIDQQNIEQQDNDNQNVDPQNVDPQNVDPQNVNIDPQSVNIDGNDTENNNINDGELDDDTVNVKRASQLTPEENENIEHGASYEDERNNVQNEDTETSNVNTQNVDQSNVDNAQTDTQDVDQSNADNAQADTQDVNVINADTSETGSERVDSNTTQQSEVDDSETQTVKTAEAQTDSTTADTIETNQSQAGEYRTDSTETNQSEIDRVEAGTVETDQTETNQANVNTDTNQANVNTETDTDNSEDTPIYTAGQKQVDNDHAITGDGQERNQRMRDVEIDNANINNAQQDNVDTNQQRTNNAQQDNVNTNQQRTNDAQQDNVDTNQQRTNNAQQDNVNTDQQRMNNTQQDNVNTNQQRTNDAQQDNVNTNQQRTNDTQQDNVNTNQQRMNNAQQDNVNTNQQRMNNAQQATGQPITDVDNLNVKDQNVVGRSQVNEQQSNNQKVNNQESAKSTVNQQQNNNQKVDKQTSNTSDVKEQRSRDQKVNNQTNTKQTNDRPQTLPKQALMPLPNAKGNVKMSPSDMKKFTDNFKENTKGVQVSKQPIIKENIKVVEKGTRRLEETIVQKETLVKERKQIEQKPNKSAADKAKMQRLDVNIGDLNQQADKLQNALQGRLNKLHANIEMSQESKAKFEKSMSGQAAKFGKNLGAQTGKAVNTLGRATIDNVFETDLTSKRKNAQPGVQNTQGQANIPNARDQHLRQEDLRLQRQIARHLRDSANRPSNKE